MENNSDFFKKIQSFQKIQTVFENQHYVELPSDWHVIVTDVKNSTIAVTEGKYKEVNMAGALSIIAVKNALNDEAIPFVFGGDGATIVVPGTMAQAAMKALTICQYRVMHEFGLQLRFGSIPYHNLQSKGFIIDVAKYEMSAGNEIAMLRGSGLSEAEKQIKSVEAPTNTVPASSEKNFDGLECRWNPIPSKKGLFLSVIVQPRNPNDISVLSEIAQKIFTTVQDRIAVDFDQLPKTWPPQHLKQELQIKHGIGAIMYVKMSLIYILTFLFSLVLKSVKRESKNGASEYLHQLIANTDYFKIEGSIKFVIDTSTIEREQILKLLNDYHQTNKIFFGYNESPFAVITCFVRSLTNHVHFIDGGNGGYTKAAVMLKTQMKNT